MPTVGDATRLVPGEQVFAVGCPRRLGFTASRGIVSFVGRPMDGARRIPSDLPIDGGNSGGPLVDEHGELVGVVSFVLRRSHGLAFALPINHAIERFPPLAALALDPGYLDRFRKWRE